MKNITKVLALAGFVAVMSLSAGNALAQGRGNFDPSQFRQMRIDRMRDQLDVKDDAEWKVLETSIGKVVDAQMEVMSGRFGGMRGGTRGGGSGGTSTSTNSASSDQSSRRQRGGGGGIGGTPSPEMEALQKAIDDKAASDVIKAKLAALRDSVKAKEDKLEAAQADLRKLLTPRQEAVAVLGGMLK